MKKEERHLNCPVVVSWWKKRARVKRLDKTKKPKVTFAYGHTFRNTPDPIWTRKLSLWGPGKYRGGGPRGKTFGCCRLFTSEKPTTHENFLLNVAVKLLRRRRHRDDLHECTSRHWQTEKKKKRTQTKKRERACQIYGLLQQTVDLAPLWFFLSSSSFASFPLCFHVFPAGGRTQFEALLINLIEMVLDHKKKK